MSLTQLQHDYLHNNRLIAYSGIEDNMIFLWFTHTHSYTHKLELKNGFGRCPRAENTARDLNRSYAFLGGSLVMSGFATQVLQKLRSIEDS